METEMGPLSSPGTTSYRLPIVTIGLSLTVYAVLRMFQTDGRISLAVGGVGHYALKCTGRQKCVIQLYMYVVRTYITRARINTAFLVVHLS